MAVGQLDSSFWWGATAGSGIAPAFRHDQKSLVVWYVGRGLSIETASARVGAV